MAWTARIVSFMDNPVPNGVKYLTAEFFKENASFRREFKFVPDSDTSAEGIQTFLAQQCARLDAADALGAEVEALVGNEITSNGQTGVVRMWAARAVLTEAGLFASVDAAIQASGNAAWIAAWEYSPDIHRNAPMVAAMAAGLGLTDAQVDALFAQAAALTV